MNAWPASRVVTSCTRSPINITNVRPMHGPRMRGRCLSAQARDEHALHWKDDRRQAGTAFADHGKNGAAETAASSGG